ncbi:histidine kinase [Actinoplanes sp. CA-142083]|uniref:sensor histidine kinase n=1 Tax=Actinoplanes sp. CA-142083 TaxID=3239903 RepID=UPI003D91E461
MSGTSKHRTAATTVVAVALCTAFAALVMLPFSRTDEAWTEWFFLNDVVVAVVYGLLAGLLIARGALLVGALAALAAIGDGLAAIGQRYPLLEVAGGPPFAEQLTDVVGTAWVPGTLALITVVPWLVRDEPLPRHARAAVAAGAAVSAAITLMRVIRPVNGLIRVGSPEWDAFVENTLPVQMTVVVFLGLAATGDAVRRWRRLPEDRRRGLGWLAIGSALMALSFVPLAVPLPVSAPLAYASVTPVLHLAAQAFFPAATLAVVLRQRLWGIDVAVSRTLVWSLLTAGSVAAYVVIAQAVVHFVPLPGGAAGAIAAGTLAVAVFPARTWLQDRVDHLVRGPAARRGAAAEQVARRIGTDAAGPVTGALEAVRDALRLHSAELRVGDQTLATAGTPGGPPLEVALSLGDGPVGVLAVTGAPGERLDARTSRELAALAGPIAAVARLAVLTSELDAARRRTTAARVEERRLLRRELHDRLGPTLVGVALTVQGARNLLAADRPEEADDLLDLLRADLDRSAEDVRTLSRALLPPSLEQHGLGTALAELSTRLGDRELAVAADIEGDADDLPPELAAGLYGIAAEALVNARRHARAENCAVRLTVTGESVRLEIADDGQGLGDAESDIEPGVGLRSMRERAAELGGTVQVAEAVPHGTLVQVVVPR